MHTTPSTSRWSLRHLVQFAPDWLMVVGALLLVLACCFPWMLLFDSPLTSTRNFFDGAGGIRQEPIWFALSLFAVVLAFVRFPYRRHLLIAIVAAFVIKLWFAYRALQTWFRLNELQAGRASSDGAPLATYGLGWYFLIGGCAIMIVLLISRRVREHRQT